MTKATRIGRRLLLGVTIVTCLVLALAAAAVLVEKRLDTIFASRYEKQLNTLTGFDASVGSASVYFTDRRFVFEDIVIRKEGVGERPPYFRVETMEVELDGPWYDRDSRLHVTLRGPKMHLVRGGENPQLEPDPAWREKVSAQLPYEADSLTIRDGEVVFVDRKRGSRWHAHLSGSARHLVAGADPDASQSVVAGVTASFEGGGRAFGRVETKTGMEVPPFWLRVAVQDLPLDRIESLLQRRFDLQVKEGLLTVIVQASGESGHFTGRVRPKLERADLTSHEGRDTLKSVVGEWVARRIDDPLGGRSAWIPVEGDYGPGGTSIRAGGDLSLLQGELIKGLSQSLEN